ncbi:MAG: amino acid ABC transporter permease [Proteobacteria bacterium]|nr:MAG: amino acid ABC transporter permease [Pseudomonadota bacterium]
MRSTVKTIPGVDVEGSTDLPVLRPFALDSDPHRPTTLRFSRWLAGPSVSWVALFAILALAAPLVSHAAVYDYADAFDALIRWIPYLVGSGFLFNVLISVLAMAIGTLLGAALGLGQVSHHRGVNAACWFVTQTFRNSPWLVLLFVVMLAFPFEIRIGDTIIPVPDWIKAVFGLSLPVMANISEIVRGAVQSIPGTQWEASESLAFTRRQTMWMIILPQCIKRMIPPWMNWYAILTMATPLCSILGVEEIVNLSRQAIESEDNHPELLVPFYTFVLILFFAYCYPIAKITIYLERKYSVKI